MATIFVVAPARCAAPEAILHFASGTTVDGTPAMDGMRIGGGQKVHTPEGRFSELLMHGSTIRVLGNANLEYDGDSAELVEGGVALTTSNQFPVHCGCASIAPVHPGKTRYLVQLEQRTVYVTSQEGDLSVKSRKKSKTVPTGKTAAVFCGAAAQEILFVGENLPVHVIAGSVAASAIAGPVINWKMNVSGVSPDQ